MPRPSKEILIQREQLFLEGLYLCGKCSEVKPLLEFGNDSKQKHGVRSWCKACINSYNKASNEKVKSRIGERAFLDRKKNQLDKWKKNTRPKRLEHFKRKEKEANLKRLYGLSIHDFNVMLANQGGRCAICCTVKPHSKWHVDHCHETGEVRGILCQLCNVGIGAFRESQDALEMARIYLRPRGKI